MWWWLFSPCLVLGPTWNFPFYEERVAPYGFCLSVPLSPLSSRISFSFGDHPSLGMMSWGSCDVCLSIRLCQTSLVLGPTRTVILRFLMSRGQGQSQFCSTIEVPAIILNSTWAQSALGYSVSSPPQSLGSSACEWVGHSGLPTLCLLLVSASYCLAGLPRNFIELAFHFSVFRKGKSNVEELGYFCQVRVKLGLDFSFRNYSTAHSQSNNLCLASDLLSAVYLRILRINLLKVGNKKNL